MKRFFLILYCFANFSLGKAQTIDTLISVGNHKLHFNIIMGKGMPILFEAGNGDDATVWQSIVTQVYNQTNATIITYDRAGLGKSEIDTATISFQNEVNNLETALNKLGFSQQLFIVCHSFGGYYASLFTYQNIKKVKGVVCIDIATPCFFTKNWSDEFIKTINDQDWNMIKQYKPGLYYVLKSFTKTAVFMADKFFNSSTPVTMIMAENIQPMIKNEERAKWIDCCKSFGTMPNHNFIMAKNADHKVWEKNPNVVINELVKLYNKVK